jgi:hypothetical protein
MTRSGHKHTWAGGSIPLTAGFWEPEFFAPLLIISFIGKEE